MLMFKRITFGLGTLFMGLFGVASLAPQSTNAQSAAPPSSPKTYKNVESAAAAVKTGSARPRLGVGLTFSAIITLVSPGSAGARAGLKVGDRVTQFNHQKVANSDSLVQLVQDTVTRQSSITVVRDGKTLNLAVTFPQSSGTPRIAQAAPTRESKRATPALKLRPGYVIGRATFPDGRPIPEFTVTVMGFDAVTAVGVGGDRGLPVLGYETGHNGIYAVQTKDTRNHEKPVNGLVVNVAAQTTIAYNGKKYIMDLVPADDKWNWREGRREGKEKGRLSAGGLTCDFVLKIAGLKPGGNESSDSWKQSAYIGAALYLREAGDIKLRDKFPADARLVFTLTPQGPLLDGSTGKTLTREVRVSALGTDAGVILDIPIGVYSVQAKVINGGVSTPLSVRLTWGDEAWKSTVTADFPPVRADTVLTGPDYQTLELKQ